MRSPGGALESILVAVPTTGVRPVLPLLQELVTQARAAAGGGRHVRVLLLDNSGDNSARARADAAAAGAEYLRVAWRGFAQVRNAALDAAAGQDALIFIDDDEWPCREWLEALVEGAEQMSADVVLGPVDVRVPADAPRWLDGGAVLRERYSQPDGPLLCPAYSGNTLLRISAVLRLQARFESRFDRSGGEDTAFFAELSRQQAVFGWVQGALAFEVPDPDRLTLRGAARRAYRSGRVQAVFEQTAATRSPAHHAVRRTGRVARGLVRIARGASTGHSPDCARGTMDLAFAWGWLASTLGAMLGPGVKGSRS
ncbi:glycosyltransferase [Streptacidiphilus sp. EB129]|uniref:glycosyltransferase n=1 Tax=Streptacidiphilus sp. EB129 TaxID=3156262 RepID=UPI00351679E0